MESVKFKKDQAVIFNKTIEGRYAIEDTGIVDEVLIDDKYNIKSAGKIIYSVPSTDIVSAYNERSEIVDKILREKEKGKEFKDSDIRVGGSKKEMMAYKGLMTSADLADLEKDPIIARKLINKQKVYPEINLELEKQNLVSSGAVYLKYKLREACGANPPDNEKARKLYVGFISYIVDQLSSVIDVESFKKMGHKIAYESLHVLISIASPEYADEIIREQDLLNSEMDKLQFYIDKKQYIFKQLEAKYNTFWQWENTRNNFTGIDKELSDTYYYLDNLCKEITRYKYHKTLPIEIKFAEEHFPKKMFNKENILTKFLCRDMLIQIFGVTFVNFLTQNSESALKKIEEAISYSRFTQEDYDKIYSSIINPTENKLVSIQSAIDYLNDPQKTYKEKYTYATEVFPLNNWSVTGIAEFKKPTFFKDLLVKNDANLIMSFINIMVGREDIGLKRYLKSQKAYLEKLFIKYKVKDDDFSWIENPKETKKIENKASLQINSGEPLTYIKRVGGVAVFESDLNTGDKVLDFYKNVLGITGVTYGQSLPDLERGIHAKHFAGSILDLAELLNWDVKDLIKLNDLKIKFAASGHGRAMAHFEPDRIAINLTRKKGDGTVAHEMAHYFDKAIENLFPNSRKTVKRHAAFASFMGAVNVGNIQIHNAFKTIMDFIRYGIPVDLNGEPVMTLDFNKGYIVFPYLSKEFNDYLLPFLVDFAKEVTQKSIVIEVEKSKSYKLKEKYQDFEEALKKTQERYPHYFFYQIFMKEKNARQYLEALLNTFNIDSYKFTFVNHLFRKTDFRTKSNTSTAFYINSSMMSSEYWTFDWELFARGFETFIAFRQIKLERENNYLVSGAFFDYPQGVYPVGIEREILYVLYDNLFNVIKSELGIRDFIPFREERVNEYTVLTKNDEVSEELIIDEKNNKPIAEEVSEEVIEKKLIDFWSKISNSLNQNKKLELGGEINEDLINALFSF